MDSNFASYRIEDRSYVAFVKRDIHSKLLQANFPKTRIAEIDIIISELASNIIKHAGEGELLYRIENQEDVLSFEIISIDDGPGIADVQKMMKDGVSTKKTLGHGLGAISRLSNDFQIYSIPKWGTICYSFVRATGKDSKRVSKALETKSICVAKPAEDVCGDKSLVVRRGDIVKVFLADGLGHGKYAHEAVSKAVEFMMQCQETDPVEMIRQMHTYVRKTRGLVGSIGVLNLKERLWKFCGVGNISSRLYDGLTFKNCMAYNGIIGLHMPNSMTSSYVEADKNQHLIMCSDGIKTRWDLGKYPSILKYDAMLLAASLYKDYNRRTDDTSVFVGKVIL
jgi:anti-sigma regulatory factor (Ser/Thr protein kinase)